MKGILTVLLFTSMYSFAQGDTLKAKKAKRMINKEVIVKPLLRGRELLKRMVNAY